MKLRFALTRLDLIRGALRASTFNPALRIYVVVVFGGALAFSFKSEIARGKTDVGYLVCYGIVLLLILGGATLAGALLVATLNALLGKGRGVLGEHTLEITEAGLIERTDVNESLHKWAGIGAVRTTRGHYFIRVTEFGGAFHLVPRRAGAILEGDADTFVAEVRRRVASRQG